ncbi:MAG: PH domain-containing protein [Actinomycetota bacterium]|nr:PH domain-containing protein [Actinomycetota bacterium]
MDLNPGEVVIFEGRPSWRSILGFYILGLLAVAAAFAIGLLAADAGIGAAAGGAVLLIVLLWGWLKRISTRYAITNRRIHIRRGILSRNIEETRLDRLQDTRVQQGLGQRLLGVGTVDFGTSAESGAGFRFEGIANPDHVARQIDRVLHEADAPAPPVPPPPAS